MKNDDLGNYEKINILTLGNTTVGKTCFILRFTENFFQPIYLTTCGIDSKYKFITLSNSKSYKAIFYDTAGQERHRSISLNQIKSADGILLMYDVTNQDSFNAIKGWMDNIREIKGNNFPVILVGNKIDLKEERKISQLNGQNLADSYGISFYEISNKTGENVEEATLDLINKISDCLERGIIFNIKNDKTSIVLNKKTIKTREKNKCC